MSKQDEMQAKMLESIEEKTGLKPEVIVDKIKGQAIEKHMQKVKYVKEEFGLSHGFANLLVHLSKGTAKQNEEADELETQFKGKELPRKWYDSIVEQICKWEGVELVPKKAYVSLRTKKKFGILQPSTKSRLDVGLNLKGLEVEEGLEKSGSFNSMVTHRYRIESEKDMNKELMECLNIAYQNSL